jgi:hypothetical protein
LHGGQLGRASSLGAVILAKHERGKSTAPQVSGSKQAGEGHPRGRPRAPLAAEQTAAVLPPAHTRCWPPLWPPGSPSAPPPPPSRSRRSCR